MGGPAADNTNLRAKVEATPEEIRAFLVEEMHDRCPAKERLAKDCGGCCSRTDAIWPLVVAFGDARYQEGESVGYANGCAEGYEAGRKDAASAVQNSIGSNGLSFDETQGMARLARGEG